MLNLKLSKKDIKSLINYDASSIIGAASLLLANADPYFTLMYADIGCRISADMVVKKHADKCIQCGIAEQNMVCVASAMANEGFHVFAAAYGPFITARVLDQIRVYMGIMESPVTLVGVVAGLIASDLGPASTSLEDIAHMRSIPNITIISPADCIETVKAMQALCMYDNPTYLRLTAGFPNQIVYHDDYHFEIGKIIQLRKGTQTAIFATGTIVYQCLGAAKILEEQGISCAILNVHTIKPLDTETIDRFANYQMIFSVEEHSIIGGLGSAIAEYISEKYHKLRLKRIGTPDHYINADSFDKTIEKVGLSSSKIAEQIILALRKLEEN